MLGPVFLIYLISVFGVVGLESVNFNEAEDCWKGIVKEKSDLLESLNKLLHENKETARKELILKVATWARANNLQVT
jgi:hypothetical protein